MPDVVIAIERWRDALGEGDALGGAHFVEVEGPLAKMRPYRPNHELFARANDAGFLHLVTARVDGVLAGYCTWTVSDDPESTGLLKAEQGALYVSPAYRKLCLGPKIVDFSTDYLRSKGVHFLLMHHRMLGRGARLGLWFTRALCAIEIKREYFIWIGEQPRG